MMNFARLQTIPVTLALIAISLTSQLFSAVASARCEERVQSAAFLPTWRLLSREQKEQFIAGYLQGFSDAAKLTDVVIGYIDENPGKAKDGLLQLKRIYNSVGLTPAEMVGHVDQFYADPDNRDAALSIAVSAARSLSRSRS